MHVQRRAYHQNYMPLWVPALIGGFWMQYNDFLTRITSLYGSQTSPVLLCMQNSVISIRFTSLHWFQPSSVVFAFKKLSFGPGITSLCGSLTSPVDLCMQNSVICTRMTSLYGFQPSPVVCAFKRVTLGTEYHVSMDPIPYLCFCAFERATYGPELLVSMGPRHHLSSCAFKKRY